MAEGWAFFSLFHIFDPAKTQSLFMPRWWIFHFLIVATGKYRYKLPKREIFPHIFWIPGSENDRTLHPVRTYVLQFPLDLKIRNQLNTTLLQRRSRTRPCNVAQNGGSTSVCTSTGIRTQSCNNNYCREFQLLFNPEECIGRKNSAPRQSVTFMDQAV